MSSQEQQAPQPSLDADGYAWPPLPARRLVRHIARQIARDKDGLPTIPQQRERSE
jgi:hypothetical protein